MNVETSVYLAANFSIRALVEMKQRGRLDMPTANGSRPITLLDLPDPIRAVVARAMHAAADTLHEYPDEDPPTLLHDLARVVDPDNADWHI